MNNSKYKEAFGIPEDGKGDVKYTLEKALDIRKFEIELYWKRATYFWAFLAVTLGAYFTLFLAKVDSEEKGEALLIVSCLGVVFSVTWYFVNRASKFWQENWEYHVNLLEDTVIGPMYKTVLRDADLSFRDLWGPYPFSVSKLNQTLSLFILVLFLFLLITTLWRYYHIAWPPNYLATATVMLTAAVVVALWWKGRTRWWIERSRQGVSRVRARNLRTELIE